MTCITTTKFSFYCLFNFVSKSGHYLIWLQTYRCLRKYKVNLSGKSFGVAKRHNNIRIDLRQCCFLYNFNVFVLNNATKIVIYIITLRDSNTIGANCDDYKFSILATSHFIFVQSYIQSQASLEHEPLLKHFPDFFTT